MSRRPALITSILIVTAIAILSAPGSSSALDHSVLPSGQKPHSGTFKARKLKKQRVAESVSEKEAFDLAKEVGTITAWNAFLDKFPEGFRAEIAKSYIDKLKNGSVNNADGGEQSAPAKSAGASKFIKAANLWGAYRIATRKSNNTYINNTETGIVSIQPNDLDRRSGHWLFESVPDTHHVRIRNRWKGTYLIVDEGVVQSEQKSKSDKLAHWALETAPGSSEFIILRNRQTGQYLSPDSNGEYLFAQDEKPDGTNGQWRLVEMDDAPATTSKPASKPAKKRSASIKCSGGYIRKGVCKCSGGKTRIKLGSNSYKCKRRKAQKPAKKPAAKSCYTAGCSGFCGPGFVMIKGKCMHISDYEQLLQDQEG